MASASRARRGEVRRPVLKYHGGKWRLAPWVAAHLPAHETYVEPFGGAASVLLRKPPAALEVYNDLDGEIVNVFRVLRSPRSAARLRALLARSPFARDEFARGYRPARGPIEQARRTIVRAWLGFGTVAASGRRTGFSGAHPAGARQVHAWCALPAALRAVTERLRRVVIESADALAVVAKFDSPGTLFYVDPPYVLSTRHAGAASRVYRHELDDQQHAALAERLHAVRGMVVLSGYPSALYERLYARWERVETRTTCAAGVYGSRFRTEVLWLSPSASAALRRS